jgi:hypothetical protein
MATHSGCRVPRTAVAPPAVVLPAAALAAVAPPADAAGSVTIDINPVTVAAKTTTS